ncbi:DHHA1 domain-containing protein [Psychrobium sp. 1_MG-2023]|uniref:DHHA1 domain-containing protein n=1 Tax=Psychrobium sp. 1_MG-2023 TaxID=3062624 RepID=UPI000C321BE5|nr:DHHA1 domain-containing protein [Psychrobium sp. 1_MG-2023]MDP2560483.1 DHHA1 domain-containing protein [Psychrobium sp. 1_MG-2023]PKF57858.1 phosphoesterase [Alteromonadales bacterium alter-6D02]
MSHFCIYHKNCSDGFGSALAVHVYCQQQQLQCDYLPAQYGDDVPDVTGKDVLIVDFSYDRETLIKMKQQANSLLVIDHHKSAMEALSGLDYCIFDMDYSGAVLTWRTLLPQQPVPLLLNYIQDRDLWRWQLDETKAVSAALLTIKQQFELWQPYLEDALVVELINKGNAIVEYQQQQLAKLPSGENIPLAEIAGYTVPCVNSTHLVSEMGDILAQGHPFAALYFDKFDKRIFSLRSAKDGIDVAKIAQKYGGGGHFHAAGFAIAKEPIKID